MRPPIAQHGVTLHIKSTATGFDVAPWTSTSYKSIGIGYDTTNFGTNTLGPTYGCMIRCIRDSSDGWTSDEIVTDIDGNTYHTIQVGTQIWLVENLATRRYNNGDLILEVTNAESWVESIVGILRPTNHDWMEVFDL